MNGTISTVDIVGKLCELVTRRITATISASHTLRVQPSRLLTDADRAWFRAHSGAVVAYLESVEKGVIPLRLTGGKPWDKTAANRLTHSADALVECLGVSGTHPENAAAAAMVSSAYATGNMETLRFACSEFGVLVRQLAAQRDRAERRKVEETHSHVGDAA